MKKSIIKRRKRVVPALRDQSPTAATHSSNGSSASPEASPAALAHDEHYRYMSSEPMDAPRPMSFAPPPVDFTGFHMSSTPLQHNQLPKLLEPVRLGNSPVSQYGRRSASPNSLGVPKKRTLAETAAEALPIPTTLESGSNQLPPIMSSAHPSPPGRLSSISSILNHTDSRDESRMDPSHMGRQPTFQAPIRSAPAPAPAPHNPQSLPGISSFADIPSDVSADRRAQLQREAEQMREALRAKERELAQMGR